LLFPLVLAVVHTQLWEKQSPVLGLPETMLLLFFYRTLHASFGIYSDVSILYDDTPFPVFIQVPCTYLA
jgi:hypothetical protein